jgi:flagellar biosynthesis chaperone FliJ
MPRRDPLEVLARLRARERDQARRDLAVAEAGRVAADAAQAAVAEALRREAGAAAGDYAAWLPAAKRDETQAAQAVRRAEAEAEFARIVLVRARAEAEAVEQLRAARAAARRAARLSREQATLDDLPR